MIRAWLPGIAYLSLRWLSSGEGEFGRRCSLGVEPGFKCIFEEISNDGVVGFFKIRAFRSC